MQIYDRIIYGIWVVGSYVYKGEKCEMPLEAFYQTGGGTNAWKLKLFWKKLAKKTKWVVV